MNPRLRALLRLLAFAVLVFIAFPAKGRLLRAALHGLDGTIAYVVDHLIELAAVLLFAGIMAAVERRPFAAFGMPWRHALRARFWQGAAAGLVALTVLVLALQGVGAIRLGAPTSPPLMAAAFGLAYAILFVLLAAREEFQYRGYGLFTLAQIVGFWPAAVVSTAWFTWTHAGNAGESPLGLANVAAFGLLACLMLRRTGDLWMPIGFHAVWDWGQTYLFGVGDSGHPPPPGHLFTATISPTAPDWLSGAAVGPEGSALCLALMAVVGLLYVRTLRGVRYPEAATRNANSRRRCAGSCCGPRRRSARSRLRSARRGADPTRPRTGRPAGRRHRAAPPSGPADPRRSGVRRRRSAPSTRCAPAARQ